MTGNPLAEFGPSGALEESVDGRLHARVLEGFDDPSFGAEAWNALVRTGDTDVVHLTWHWQRAWWQAMGRGQLLLVVAERDRRVVALAPFYADSGMVFFVGSGSADYSDFIGDISDAEVLDLLLETARRQVSDFVGFRFYCVLETSRTGARLKAAAPRLGCECYEEKRWPAPVVDLATDPEAARGAADGRRASKRDRYFRNRGALSLRQFTDSESIAPYLETFFEQHIARWALAGEESEFLERPHRTFFEILSQSVAALGWLRFSMLDWDGQPIAFEHGLCYEGTYFGGPSSFAVSLASRSPGQVLLRRLVLSAIDQGVRTYDLGVGDEPYKFRLATGLRHVGTWGLYPIELLQAQWAQETTRDAGNDEG